MKRILSVCFLLAMMLGLSSAARAQSAYPYAYQIPNDPTTGTTQFTLTKLTSAGQAVVMATTDTHGYIGVCVDNCGKTGSAWIAFVGPVPVVMENTATILHYVQVGSTTGGEGHDTGATTFPTSGGDVIGVIQTAATSGNPATVMLDPESAVPLTASTQTIASGTASLGTSAIASGACATVVTVSATGVAATDTITWAPNASIKAVTGYAPSTSGGLSVVPYPTANNVNFDVCNFTASSVTPGAVTLNFRVVR